MAARLAAIVANSDDVILSKTLEGIITSWNGGAERIFGYTADEMIGQHISKIIPPELMDEEKEIIARLTRGERIEHFETIRVAKDGRRIHIFADGVAVAGFDRAHCRRLESGARYQ